MKLIELIIDENMELSGIDGISIVENPAIEEHFVALNENEIKVEFAQVDAEKRIVIGALLVPDKPIFRNDDVNGEHNIFFSKDTVRKCMELFFMNGNQNKTTFEHNEKLTGLTLVESWIVEDLENDKSKFYNLSVPIGTWCGTMKINNDVIWNDFVKTGKVKGFSIEGFFADKSKIALSDIDVEITAGIELLELKNYLENYEKR